MILVRLHGALTERERVRQPCARRLVELNRRRNAAQLDRADGGRRRRGRRAGRCAGRGGGWG